MGNYISVDVNSITTREPQRLILDHSSAIYIKGRRVCLLDDDLMGNTMKALEKLMGIANADVACKAAIWIEGPWIDERKFQYVDELPIFIE
ncbi:MAG: hypothetical protein ACP5GZ_06255 [Vulcanisaeta sp.]|jgi:adenine phosphoribosyltransferase|uniref:hypothetical protein n=1 Tax=Vulcanisaeta sp. TaxID=2020871 RepID=UPI003D11BB43